MHEMDIKTKTLNENNNSKNDILNDSVPSASYEEAKNVFTKIIFLHTSRTVEQQEFYKNITSMNETVTKNESVF